jgi:7-carboxy-7-deazaguanine synthase
VTELVPHRVADLIARRDPTLQPTLPLSEQFGPTLQGEGPAAGRPCWFVRLGGCNLSCSWCDTQQTWNGARYDLRKEITTTPAAEIAARVPDRALVVITGGEPLLHQHSPGWQHLLADLAERGCTVHIETNGTIAPTPWTVWHTGLFVVSPKQPHAGPHRGSQSPAVHDGWRPLAAARVAHLKVVVRDVADVDQAAALGASLGWPVSATWVMPEGTSADVLATRWPAIATAAAERGLSATHRLHVLAWGDTRGH